MIEFDCPTCGHHFTMKDSSAGRKGRCKFCGTRVEVPVFPPQRHGYRQILPPPPPTNSEAEEQEIHIDCAAVTAERSSARSTAREALASIGGVLTCGVIGILVMSVGAVIILGSAWASSKLLPLFWVLSIIGLAILVFVMLPLAIPRATRGYAAIAIFITSFVFGASLWMESLLLTLAMWGVIPVVIGVMLFGVGVVPIAFLATLFKGEWLFLFELFFLVFLTYVSRVGALTLAESVDR